MMKMNMEIDMKMMGMGMVWRVMNGGVRHTGVGVGDADEDRDEDEGEVGGKGLHVLYY